MLSALSKAGLVDHSEVAANAKQEADAVRQKVEAMRPKSLKELFSRNDYDFFARVQWIIEALEKDQEIIGDALEAVEKHMLGGQAGRDFHKQLCDWRFGRDVKISLDDIKAKWPKVFGKA
ncbi:MAG TPA: hypothetical protein VFT82_00635 [Candidatus Paceibacterota bacterium]|nr:hypothetical protein [Candidatus Paceibacterota bacterium]